MMVGTSHRPDAISMPGVILSQLVTPTHPSKQWALTISSTQSEMVSLEAKRITHAGMAHRYAVAYARDTEDERDAACLDDPLPDLVDELVEMDVTWNDVVLGVRNADERLREVRVGQTQLP